MEVKTLVVLLAILALFLVILMIIWGMKNAVLG